MFKKLQRKYMAEMILCAVLCWLGIVFIVQMFMIENNLDIPGLMEIWRQEKPQDFNSLSAGEIQEGMYVKGEIPVPVDRYLYWDKNKMTAYDEFIIPVGENKYMGVSCGDASKDILEKNMQENIRRLVKNQEDTTNITPVQIEGVIKKLSDESLEYYRQQTPHFLFDAEQKISYIPYVLVERNNSSIDWSSIRTDIILILILLGVSIYCIVKGITGRNIKELKKYCAAQGDLEYGLYQMEQFYESGVPVHGLRLDNRYFLMVIKNKVHFVETRDIVWIYPNVTKHSINYIPTRKTYAIKIKKRNGKELKIDIRNKRIMDDLMGYIASQTPYIILGYDKDVELLYIRNRNDMIHEVDRRRQERLGVIAQTMERPSGQTVPTGEDGFYENRNL